MLNWTLHGQKPRRQLLLLFLRRGPVIKHIVTGPLNTGDKYQCIWSIFSHIHPISLEYHFMKIAFKTLSKMTIIEIA